MIYNRNSVMSVVTGLILPSKCRQLFVNLRKMMGNVNFFVKPLRGVMDGVDFWIIQNLICCAEFVTVNFIVPNFAAGDQF